MGRIYGQACHVIAWLGDAASDSRAGIILLRCLGGLIDEQSAGDDQHSPSDGHSFDELVDAITVETVEDIFNLRNTAWQGAISLVKRQWFSRL